MIYSDFAIEQLKGRLHEKSMRDSTPKKYSGDMFEAYEVIGQLQKQLLKYEKKEEAEPLPVCKGIKGEDIKAFENCVAGLSEVAERISTYKPYFRIDAAHGRLSLMALDCKDMVVKRVPCAKLVAIDG